MKRDLAEQLESLAEGFASGSLGVAVGLLVYHLLAPATVQPLHGGFVAAAALIAYGNSRSLLGLVGRRLPVVTAADDSALDSAIVVPLFDPAEAGKPGPSTAAIDLPRDAPGDATHSLHEALSQLRQSLANRR
jgi:hypothetical protein